MSGQFTSSHPSVGNGVGNNVVNNVHNNVHNNVRHFLHDNVGNNGATM